MNSSKVGEACICEDFNLKRTPEKDFNHFNIGGSHEKDKRE